ncbi:hypothetical protein MUK42_37276, partial [Musa troglodytarum]
MIQGSARNKPISLLSHAQKRIHIGNHGIPVLHDVARSPSLLLVMTARSANYSLHQDSDCDILGPCKTKADCAAPCKAAGHSPTAVLCVPDPTGADRGT